jgi:hypothetical protein
LAAVIVTLPVGLLAASLATWALVSGGVFALMVFIAGGAFGGICICFGAYGICVLFGKCGHAKVHFLGDSSKQRLGSPGK